MSSVASGSGDDGRTDGHQAVADGYGTAYAARPNDRSFGLVHRTVRRMMRRRMHEVDEGRGSRHSAGKHCEC